MTSKWGGSAQRKLFSAEGRLKFSRKPQNLASLQRIVWGWSLLLHLTQWLLHLMDQANNHKYLDLPAQVPRPISSGSIDQQNTAFGTNVYFESSSEFLVLLPDTWSPYKWKANLFCTWSQTNTMSVHKIHSEHYTVLSCKLKDLLGICRSFVADLMQVTLNWWLLDLPLLADLNTVPQHQKPC